MEDERKCPFRKTTYYIAGRNTGQGYPDEWRGLEEFEPCLKEKCMCYSRGECKLTTTYNPFR